MKKILLICLIFTMSKVQAQQSRLYLDKAIKQNNTGLTIALGGALICSIGAISKEDSYSSSDKKVFRAVMYSGIGISVAGLVVSSLSWTYIYKANSSLTISPDGLTAKIEF